MALLIKNGTVVSAEGRSVADVRCRDGRIAEVGPSDQILRDPQHPYTRLLLDTVPDLEMTGRERVPVAGEVPSPIDPPPGCAFHPRCQFANDRCRHERPELILHNGSKVACHAVQEERI